MWFRVFCLISVPLQVSCTLKSSPQVARTVICHPLWVICTLKGTLQVAWTLICQPLGLWFVIPCGCFVPLKGLCKWPGRWFASPLRGICRKLIRSTWQFVMFLTENCTCWWLVGPCEWFARWKALRKWPWRWFVIPCEWFVPFKGICKWPGRWFASPCECSWSGRRHLIMQVDQVMWFGQSCKGSKSIWIGPVQCSTSTKYQFWREN